VPAEAKAKFSNETCVPLSKRKFWHFRLMALIGVPLLFLCLLDLGLRFAGLGYYRIGHLCQ